MYPIRWRCGCLLALLIVLSLASVYSELDGCLTKADVHERFPGCPDSWRYCTFPNAFGGSDDPCYTYSLSPLFKRSEVADIVERLEAQPVWSTAPCTTDQKPAFEIYLMREGNASEAIKMGIWEKIAPLLEDCVTPLVQAKFNCSTCVPCTSLVRRYRSGERMEVIEHRDQQAEVTLVVELQESTGGGLYVKAMPKDQPTFAKMAVGDAIVHDYKLLHGVQVVCDNPHCVRYSFITWFQRHQEACEAGTRWKDSSREAQIDRTFKVFLQAARARFGDHIRPKLARQILVAHVNKGGGLTNDKFAAALDALASGPTWVAARNAEIERGLDRFKEAVSRSLKVQIKSSKARRLLAAHADERGILGKDGFFGALSDLRDEL